MISREEIFEEINTQLRQKVLESQEYLEGLLVSRNNDTKSSAGDKYETGRAMMQQEIDRAEDRIQHLRKQLNELERLQKSKQNGTCQPGAVVQLGYELFLLGPAIGKLEFNSEIIFSISMASPLGQLLSGKEKGGIVQFRGRANRIEKVL